MKFKALEHPYSQVGGNIEGSETLQALIKIIEEYQLNVSLVISRDNKWKTGNLKEMIGLSIPVHNNNVW